MKTSVVISALCTLAAVTAASSAARADVVVSAGYYDLGPSYGNSNALPNPWYGSPNTTFLGDPTLASDSDPDEAAVLLQNTGSTAVTLDPGFTLGGRTLWNSFIGTGFSIGSGDYVILGGTAVDGLDGSDEGLAGSTVQVTINGAASTFGPSSVFGGAPYYDETIPWTQLGTVTFSTGVPEASTWAMLLLGFAGIGFAGYRQQRAGKLA